MSSRSLSEMQEVAQLLFGLATSPGSEEWTLLADA